MANNSYFDSLSGFVGQIAQVEMTSFYTILLNNIWMGYLPPNAEGYEGTLIDAEFLLYNSESKIL